jgi:hypothetical protein
VVFFQKTSEQHKQVERFIQALMNSNGVAPELFVEPDGLEPAGSASSIDVARDSEDPLLELFEHKSELPTAQFLDELRRQRSSNAAEPAPSALEI